MNVPLAGYAAVAAFLFLLAGLVLAARPGSAVNRVLAALLALTGAENLVYELMRGAPTEALAIVYARTATWFVLPTLFLVPLLLYLVMVPNGRRAWRRVAVAAAAVGTVAGLALLVVAPELFVEGAIASTRRFARAGPAGLAMGVALYVVQALAVVAGAAVAASPSRSRVERRQAALVGVAFALLLGHAGGVRAMEAAAMPFPPTWNLPTVFVLTGAAGLFVVLGFLPRLSRAFEGRSRVAVLVVGVAAPLAAFGDRVVARTILADSPVYVTTRLVWVVAFALTLAVALVRFGLAGFGPSFSRRVTSASHATLVIAAATLPAAALLALTGVTSAGLLAAGGLAVAAAALSPAPLRAPASRLVRAIVLPASDPDAEGERAKRYADAVRATARREGRAPDPEATPLRDLRRELGLDDDALARILHALAAEAEAAGEPTPLLGRYRLERELGRGAFGTAFLALDVVTGERAVVKRFHVRGRHTVALAEARALAAVRHPRVVPFRDVQRVGDEMFLVMGYAAGGSALDLLRRDGFMAPARAVALVADLLDGLAALHAAGLVHRDVKPGNLLVDERGRGLIGDFGSARFQDAPDLELTITGDAALGSYSTLAPEVIRGGRGSRAADVYAAGAVLFRLLTGEHYVDVTGRSVFQVRQAILHEAPRLPHPRVPQALVAVITRALAKRPESRYASAAEMRRALVHAWPLPLVHEEERAPEAHDVPVRERA